MLLNNKGVQSANQSLPSPGGQPYSTSLNGGSRAMAATATNGASQPNVPVCECVSMCVSLSAYLDVFSAHSVYCKSFFYRSLYETFSSALCRECRPPENCVTEQWFII